MGNGDGGLFQPAVSYSVMNAGGVVGMDFNDDGKVDIVSNSGSNMISVLLGRGGGTFKSAIYYNVNGVGGIVVVADFNRDGINDMATLHWLQSTVSIVLNLPVILNTTTTTKPTTTTTSTTIESDTSTTSTNYSCGRGYIGYSCGGSLLMYRSHTLG